MALPILPTVLVDTVGRVLDRVLPDPVAREKARAEVIRL